MVSLRWTARLIGCCMAPLAWADAAERPAQLASTLQIHGNPQFTHRLPPTSTSSAKPGTIAHLPQPQQPGIHAPFPNPVSCQALVQYALANNREIQAARYQARAMSARVPQARAMPDPRLMTTAFLESIQTAAGAQEVMMSLSQQFPFFGKRALRGEVAYHDAMAARARSTAAELQVVEQVKRAYYDLYFLQNAIRETRRLQPWLGDVVDMARLANENNEPNVGLQTVYQAQMELSKLQISLAKFEPTKRGVEARLAGLLHLPPKTRFNAIADLRRANVGHTAAVLMELADTCQPELDARRREIYRDRSATELACRDYWPDVTMSLNWYEIGSTGLSPVANGEDAYALGVGISLPINRSRLDAAVRESRYKASATARRHAAAQDQLHTELQVLHAQFAEHDQVVAILQEDLERAKQTLALSLQKWRDSRLRFQQLIDVYRTLLNYRIEYHKRAAMREQAVASLERAVGCAITAEPLSDDQRVTARLLPRM